MFNVGPMEFAVIALVALVVLGPDKLPDAARQAGKWMGEFRRISSGFQTEMRSAMNEIADAGSAPDSSGADGASSNGLSGPNLDKPPSGPVEGADT